MNFVCTEDDTPISRLERAAFCEKIVTGDDAKFKSTKNSAAVQLLIFYQETKQVDKITNLCGNNEIPFDKSNCRYALEGIADDYYKNKMYSMALDIYEKAADYDTSGFTDFKIAEIYLDGNAIKKNDDQAIYFYINALEKLDSTYSSTRLAALNNLGLAYSNKMMYVNAANCFKKAARMKDATAQFNLARIYLLGHGVIADTKKAYAWISMAIAIGLKDKEREERAIKIKDLIADLLRMNDRSGKELKKAQKLAMQYYKKYVMNDSTIELEE